MDLCKHEALIKYLIKIGIFPTEERETNVGGSDYSKHVIQPWSIWMDYNLNAWDADIIKRILRTKVQEGKTLEESRIEDYKKNKAYMRRAYQTIIIIEKGSSLGLIPQVTALFF